MLRISLTDSDLVKNGTSRFTLTVKNDCPLNEIHNHPFKLSVSRTYEERRTRAAMRYKIHSEFTISYHNSLQGTSNAAQFTTSDLLAQIS